jgi:hypothetical protein
VGRTTCLVNVGSVPRTDRSGTRVTPCLVIAGTPSERSEPRGTRQSHLVRKTEDGIRITGYANVLAISDRGGMDEVFTSLADYSRISELSEGENPIW